MKTLFLLLIIYTLQNLAFSHNGAPIIYKKYPKKVHPFQDNIKLINTQKGRYQHQNRAAQQSEKFFDAPTPVESSQPRLGQPLDSSYLDFFGNLKSRVKRTQYFVDYKRAKRDVTNSNAAVKVIATHVTEAPKSKDDPKEKDAQKSKEVTKTEDPKSVAVPKAGESNPKDKVDVVSSKAAHHQTSKKNDGKVHKRNDKSPAKSHVPQKDKKQIVKHAVKQSAKPPAKLSQKTIKQVSAKKSQPKHLEQKRSALRQGRKRLNRKRALRKRKRSQHRSKHSLRQKKSASPNHGKKHHAIAINKSPKRKALGSRRLISARDAHPSDYPYVVSIQKHGQHWCAGAILNEQLIITTANCFWKSRSTSRMKVRAGAQATDYGGQTAYIAEVAKHPQWSIRKDPDHDLALALLDEPFKFSDRVHGVDLPNKVMMPPFEDAWVTSYGADRRDGIFTQRRLTLQVVYMRLIPDLQCANVTARFNVRLTDNFVCLAQAGHRAPCTRDTGAPAVSDGILWGLASWGIRKRCGTERFPAMFSYVASQDNMAFIVNATARLMSDHRLEPYLDRVLRAPLRS